MRRETPQSRRGIAAVAVIVLLLLVDLIIVGMVLGVARDQNLTACRLDTVQSFYAAESGAAMAVRELMENVDEDGDGAVGTISDDGDDGNDPQFGSARVAVTVAAAGVQTRLHSVGRAGSARRRIEMTVE